MKSLKESSKQTKNHQNTQQNDRIIISNYEQDRLKNQQYQMTSIQLQFIDKKVNKINQNQSFGPKKHSNKSIEILDNNANPIHKFNYNKIIQKNNRTKRIPTFANKYLKIKNNLAQNNSDKPTQKNLVKIQDRTLEIKDKTVDLKDKINQLIYSIASSKNLDKLERQKRQKLKQQWKSFIRQKDPKSNQQEKKTHPKLPKQSIQHSNQQKFLKTSPKVQKSSKSPFKTANKTLQRQNTSYQSDLQIKRYDKFYLKIQKRQNQKKIENIQESFGIHHEIKGIYIQKQELQQQEQTSETIDVNKGKQTNLSLSKKIISQIKNQQEGQTKKFLIQVTPLYKNNQNIQTSHFRLKSQNEYNRFKVPSPRKTTIKNQTSYNCKPKTSFHKSNQQQRTFTNNFNKKSSINMSKSVMVQKIINLRKSFNDKYKKAQKSSSPSQSKRFIDRINTQKNIISVINSQNVIQNGQILMPSINYGLRRLSFRQIFQQEKLKYQLLKKLVSEKKNSQNNISLIVECYRNNRQLCHLNQKQLRSFQPHSIKQNQKQNSFMDETFNNLCYSSVKVLNSNELNQNNRTNQQVQQGIQFKQGCYSLDSLQQNNHIYQCSSISRKTLLNSFNQKKIERQARKAQNCSHITTYNFDQIKKNKIQRPEIKQLRHKYLYRNNNIEYTPRLRKKFSKEQCHQYGISIVSVHEKNTSSLKRLKQHYINVQHDYNYLSQNDNKTQEKKQQINLKVKAKFCKLNNIISHNQLHQNGKPMLNFRSHTTPHQFSPWENQQEVLLKNFNILQFQ